MGGPARAASPTRPTRSSVYHQFMAARDAERYDEAAASCSPRSPTTTAYDCVSHAAMLRDWLLAQGAAADPSGVRQHVVDGHRGPRRADPVGAAPRPMNARDPPARPPGRHQAARAHARGAGGGARRGRRSLFHARRTNPSGRRTSTGCGSRSATGASTDGVFLVESAEVARSWHSATAAAAAPSHPVAARRADARHPRRSRDEVSAVYVDPPPPGVTTLPGHANAALQRHARHPSRRSTPWPPNGRLHQSPGSSRSSSPRTAGRTPSAGRAASRPSCSAPADRRRARRGGAAGRRRRLAATQPQARPARAGAPPRLRGEAPLPAVGAGDSSRRRHRRRPASPSTTPYLAVQGPPGTGKTYVASRVIARLVRRPRLEGRRRRAGPQGDRERAGRGRRGRGADPTQVGKKRPATPSGDHLDRAGQGRATSPSSPAGHAQPAVATSSAAPRGTSSTPTADPAAAARPRWSSTRPASSRSPTRSPSAGCPQPRSCSATRSSCRRSARASTPSPVDASALGWLLGDSRDAARRPRLLPRADLAHAPATSPRRSHACPTTAGCTPSVRSPARDGSTASSPACTCASSTTTTTRRGPPKRPRSSATSCTTCSVAPGTTRRSVATTAPGRSAAAAAQPTSSSSRPTTARSALRRTLDDAGLADVPVGTVDKFQGQEAAVVDRVDGGVVALRRLTRHGLPARPAPAQRRDLARPVLRLPGALHRAHRLRRHARRPS